MEQWPQPWSAVLQNCYFVLFLSSSLISSSHFLLSVTVFSCSFHFFLFLVRLCFSVLLFTCILNFSYSIFFSFFYQFVSTRFKFPFASFTTLDLCPLFLSMFHFPSSFSTFCHLSNRSFASNFNFPLTISFVLSILCYLCFSGSSLFISSVRLHCPFISSVLLGSSALLSCSLFCHVSLQMFSPAFSFCCVLLFTSLVFSLSLSFVCSREAPSCIEPRLSSVAMLWTCISNLVNKDK